MAKLKVKNRYGTVPNGVLNHKGLSLKAKWLYWYIESKPDDWDFSAERIAFDSKDWRDSVRWALQELEAAKLLLRRTFSLGRWNFETEYVLFASELEYDAFAEENTMTDFTTSNFTTSNFTTSKNPATKKERNTKQEISNKEIEIQGDIENVEKWKTESEKTESEMVESFLESAEAENPLLWLKIREYLEFRKAKKHPVLFASLPALMKRLQNISDGNAERAIEILDQSIANGWTGIFPVKDRSQFGKVSSNTY